MTKYRIATSGKPGGEAGFTLLELIVVMIIIGVLAAMAVPAFSHHLKVAREAVLKEDLHTMRQAIGLLHGRQAEGAGLP